MIPLDNKPILKFNFPPPIIEDKGLTVVGMEEQKKLGDIHISFLEKVTVKDLPVKEYLLPGNAACTGCPASLGLRMLGKALEGKFILVVPACCSTIIQGPFPKTAANFREKRKRFLLERKAG